MDKPSDYPLTEIVQGQIWTQEYPIRYVGCNFNAKMTLVRLSDSSLLIHSPCRIDEHTKAQILSLGPVSSIVAPGTYHYFFVSDCKEAFPEAEVFICPGLEAKLPQLEFDWILGDRPSPTWETDLEQCLIRGNRMIWEVAFLHRPSKTLILVDLIENITDKTPGTNWALRFWWKAVFRMWNHPKPAPEYQLGWKDKEAARKSLKKILDWDFERVIIAHGDLIETDAKETVRKAWEKPLER